MPKKSYLRLEPHYTLVDDDTNTSDVLARALVVYHGWIVPRLGPEDAVSGLRVDLRLRHTADATGLGDLELLEIAGRPTDAGDLGLGVAAVLPTATDSLGDDDFQIGPAAYGHRRSHRLAVSLLVRLLVSGTTWTSKLKPSVVINLPTHFFVSSDAEITVRRNDNTVPLNLKVGRAFGDHLVITFGPSVVVVGNRGDVTLELQVTCLR